MKTFKQFLLEAKQLKEEQDIDGIIGIEGDYTINNGVVDVVGDVLVIDYKKMIKNNIRFGKVSGDFKFWAPDEVKEFVGMPKEVGGDFYCRSNRFDGTPKIKSLEGAPQKVGGDFIVRGCDKLVSLKGGPRVVDGDFNCSVCNLVSLEGSPEKVGGDFDCIKCNNLVSLEGSPKIVGKTFDCSSCYKLSSLDGLSKNIKKIKCDNNLKKFLKDI